MNFSIFDDDDMMGRPVQFIGPPVRIDPNAAKREQILADLSRRIPPPPRPRRCRCCGRQMPPQSEFHVNPAPEDF